MKKLTNSEVIEKINAYCDYDTSLVDYKNSATKLCLICHQEENGVEHGIFYTTIGHLKQGHGCPKCGMKKRISKRVMSLETFIERARNVHGDKYDYSKVEYKQAQTKVCIICPKHGEFWQTPSEHLRKCGCKFCKESYLESEIRIFLIENNINFKYDVRDIEWLKPLTYDFYLPDYNIAIECQGEQHFMPIKHFGGDKMFKKRIEYDIEKYNISKKHNVNLIYYSNFKYDDNIITDKNELLKILKNE